MTRPQRQTFNGTRMNYLYNPSPFFSLTCSILVALISTYYTMKILSLIFLCMLFSPLVLGQEPIRKLLHIGIDGCRADALMSANTPAMDNLIAQSIYSIDGLCAPPTWSGNGWSTMLTGAWHTKHGVADNTFSGSDFSNYPDYLSRIETYDPNLRTISLVNWGPINSNIIQNADVETTYGTDIEVKYGALDALSNDDPDALFVAFDEVDHAGHTYGFSPSIPEYMQSIELVDSYIAEIIATMQSRPTFASENWLVLITTDHGGNVSGHGGGTIEERTIFTIYSNPGLTPEQLSKNATDQNSTFYEAFFPAQTYAVPSDQSSFSFGATQDFTIEFWVKPSAFTGDPSLISNKDWVSGYNPGFIISTYQGQYWKVNIGDGTDRVDISGGSLNPNEWHHIAVSFDRDDIMTAYEDGVFVGFEKMDAIDNIDSGLPLVINQDGTTSYGLDLNASYKDIRIWNTVISGDVISQWATVPVTSSHPNYTDLLANWQCDDGTGTVVQDQSQNNNNCIANGSISWINGQNNTFTVYDYSETTREPDNAVTALDWLCVPIQASWSLDGRSFVTSCSGNAFIEESSSNASLQINIHPNPIEDEMFLSFNSESLAVKVEIFDYQGRIVFEESIFSNTGNYNSILDTQKLANGSYFLFVRDKSKLRHTRFIK